MKIISVNFDAFRSLVDRQMKFDHRCMGLVGINESGKTNVLRALAVLSRETELTAKDAPKLFNQKNPAVRFQLLLSHDESTEIKNEIQETLDIEDAFWPECLEVELSVIYSLKDELEKRKFRVKNLDIPENTRFLNNQSQSDSVTVWKNERETSFNNVLLLTEEEIIENHKRIEYSKEKYEANEEMELVDERLEEIAAILSATKDNESQDDASEEIKLSETGEENSDAAENKKNDDSEIVDSEAVGSESNDELKTELKTLNRKRNSLIKKIEKIETIIGEYNVWSELQEALTNNAYLSDHSIPALHKELPRISITQTI